MFRYQVKFRDVPGPTVHLSDLRYLSEIVVTSRPSACPARFRSARLLWSREGYQSGRTLPSASLNLGPVLGERGTPPRVPFLIWEVITSPPPLPSGSPYIWDAI